MKNQQFAAIAWRNVLRRRKNTMGTVITIMLTIMLLIVMIGMQLGSHETIESIYTGLFEGDYQLHHKDFTGMDDTDHFSSVIKEYSPIMAALDEDKRLVATPRATQFVLVSANDKTYAMRMVGVDPIREERVSMPLKTIVMGSVLPSKNAHDMVIGVDLATFLNVKVGDSIDILGQDIYESMVVDQFRVVGIFSTGEKGTDKMLSLIHLKDFQDIFFDGSSVVHSIVSKSIKANAYPEIRGLEEQVANQYALKFWAYSDLDSTLTDMFVFQMTITAIYYGCFILLIVLTLLNSFTLMTMNRLGEFGLLIALGVDPKEFKWILLWEMLFLNSIGIILGLIAGYLWLYHISIVGFGLPQSFAKSAPVMIPKVVYPNIWNLEILIGPAIVYVSNFLIIVPPARKLKQMNVIRAITSV